ncbi:MAG TPA: chromosome partitioning protein [Pseudonocardiaceae bacterium]|nr:chromosome partitioning protein [Pseudonocardiaceae bacterium]
MLIGLCSIKGSPGVTTTAVALAARWPQVLAEPVLLEADPAGGDLGVRFGLPGTPGLGSLAAAARRTSDLGLFVEHCQVLPGGLRVVVGPLAAAQARAAVDMLASRGLGVLRAAAAALGSVVLVDAGRVDRSSPAVPLLRGASAVLVMVRSRVEDLAHVATLLAAVPTWTRCPGLVLVGSGYPRAEVERELGVPVMATLPDDPRGAGVLCGRPGGRGPLHSALGHAAGRLADQLLARIGTDTASATVASGTDPRRFAPGEPGFGGSGRKVPSNPEPGTAAPGIAGHGGHGLTGAGVAP